MKKLKKKKKFGFLCFYDWVACKECGLVYSCMPSTENGKFYLNIPKKCDKCGKKIKHLKRWKNCGLILNDKNFPKHRGRRLLLDMSSQKFPNDMFSVTKAHLTKCWGKKLVNKIFEQKTS